MAKQKPVEESGSEDNILASGSEEAMSGSEDVMASGSEDATASESGEESEEAPAAATSKRKPGSVSASRKSAADAKKSTGRARSVSGRRSGEVKTPAAARPRTSGHELIPVVCSECYEEFMFDTGIKTDSLTCPVCEHEAGRPDDALLHSIGEKRRQEKGALTLALVFVIVGLVAFAAWVVLAQDPANHADGGKFWGPLGAAIACAVLLAVFGSKYESNRWEVYF